ncbi:hypothetical protein BCF33_1762 [Hasllibacter halocynthiae]|uniref:PRC-barrel domain protein n=2 Tax=Hasllibacter halocynthiae TaxID=595589 RepID=A0A2T0X1S2_9RHOB|nr:hypothetical protein BCF33_1762 [Hasllibacter halocynthiae]
MLTGLRALLAQDVMTLDGAYEVEEGWLDPRRARLVYVEVGTGGFLSRGRALIHASRVTPGTPPRADVDAAMIEAAETEPEEGFLLDPAAMPAILTGPFGNTISPLLIAAGLRSEAVEEQAPHPDAPGSEAPHDPRETLERASEWLGAEVFGRDGELGRVDDVLLAQADWTAAHLIVQTPADRHAVPWSAVRRRAPGGHVVIAGGTAELSGSPDVPVPGDFTEGDAAAILRHWNAPSDPMSP